MYIYIYIHIYKLKGYGQATQMDHPSSSDDNVGIALQPVSGAMRNTTGVI